MQTYWNAKALNNKRLKLPCLSATLLYSNCLFYNLGCLVYKYLLLFMAGILKKVFPFSKTCPHGLFQILFLF